MGRPRIECPKKYCKNCQRELHRKTYGGGQLEGRRGFMQRVYCNRACMAEDYEGTIKRLNPKNSRRQSGKMRKESCENCESTDQLHCHHLDENPLNNDPSNLMTLCFSCHVKWHWTHGKQRYRRRAPCRYCSKLSEKSGMCQKHYQRFKKYGDPFLTKIKIGSHYVLRRETLPGQFSIP